MPETESLPQQEVEELMALYHQDRLHELIQKAALLTHQHPAAAIVHEVAGAAHLRLGRFDAALVSFDAAIRIEPDSPDAYNNRAIALLELKRLEDALASVDQAILLDAHFAEAHNNRANVLLQSGRTADALASCDRALQLIPDYAEAHNNRGNALKDLKRLSEAISSYDNALRLNPGFAQAWNNRGVALGEMKRADEALASYDSALRLNLNYAEAHNNRGNVLQEMGQLDEALASYDKALQIAHGYARAHSNRGVSLQKLARFDEALASFDKAILIDPRNAEAHNNRAIALHELQRLDEALAGFEEAVRLEPDHAAARAMVIQLKAQMCDWSGGAHDGQLSTLGITGETAPPFALLAADDCPARQLERAKAWARATCPESAAPATWPATRGERIRIGYFSADFHNHAIAHLVAGFLERHDRSRFEIHAFSHGPDKHDEMRQRLLGAVDRFHDIRFVNDRAAAQLARDNAIDLAIDLTGYTKNGRPGIFAWRAAPVQINFLGFAGTMGAEFMEYMICDRITVPDENARFHSEKLIYLPNSYFPHDAIDDTVESAPDKPANGLPEAGFVFCCFNQSYKISATEFDIWMRLLRHVEGSVLWLLNDNRWAQANLRKEAAARGIDPARLVFADKMPHADHLARHRCADLFLDTFNYNAHTTACDALRVGLPVVNRLGQSFAARVGASLLHAVGMSELVTETSEDYERLALELATHPDRLAALKAKLASNRHVAPLFDPALFARHLERGFETAYERRLAGLAPDHIHVD